jgi:very-short-patch-repair endonuclease
LVLDNRKKCESKCNLYYANLIEDEDYVVCKICNVHAKRLAGHIKLVHNLSKKEYMENHGKIISNKSSKTHSEANKITGNWINRAKENGEDLTEYCEKMSKAVSAAIMANPEDRTRRAGVMTKVNQSDVMRQKSSDTAKITSARPDIIESRTKQLQVWRDGYPDDFYNKCTKPMLNSWQSKPEKKLFEFVLELKGFKFKRNKFIKAKIFTSKTQIDMMDVKKRIYIEFDGPTHFKPIFGEDVLKVVIIKDRQLEDLIIKKNWTLIRISDDQYVDKNKIEKSYFKPECIAQLLEILNNKIPGIYKIGKAYE